jgi:hypothetical protein
MLAIPETSRGGADRFDVSLRSFREHARAIASGKAEGDAFSWFLACEYQFELEMACQWLVEAPASRLLDTEKATLRHFLASMPEVREAIAAGRQAAHRAAPAQSPEWADWLTIAALPSWNNFTVRTAIVLSQLGESARNDANFFGGR